MIYVEMGGRLGNQMFQYAFSRSLQKKFNRNDDLTLSFRLTNKEGAATQGWDDSLQLFNVIPYEKNEKLDISITQRIVGIAFAGIKRIAKLLRIPLKREMDEIWQPFLNYFGVYATRGSKYVHISDRKTKNAWCRGSFEAHKYFDNIKLDLFQEFTPKNDILKHNVELYNKILNSNSVCVSIRKGDFMLPENSKFNICSDEYYYKAIEIISKKVENCSLFIFSDDIEWVKKNMKFDYPVIYENNNGKDPVWEKLRLMYSCKHFVISNSTFAWWAQYLSRNEDKVVVAPTPWRKGEDCNGLYEDKFTLIDVFK